MLTSGQKLSREYYFDEGLGESLNDHINGVKNAFPDLTVETRRDSDGLPIVTVSSQMKFKYNLDDILSVDPEDLQRI